MQYALDRKHDFGSGKWSPTFFALEESFEKSENRVVVARAIYCIALAMAADETLLNALEDLISRVFKQRR
jgi:hypothetical protein